MNGVATHKKEELIIYRQPDGTSRQVRAVLYMEISIQEGLDRPVTVRGYGINEAVFLHLQEVYDTFCRPFPLIRLDYNGAEAIRHCLHDLGYTPPH